MTIWSEQLFEYDPFLSLPQPSNPWISDDTTLWALNADKFDFYILYKNPKQLIWSFKCGSTYREAGQALGLECAGAGQRSDW